QRQAGGSTTNPSGILRRGYRTLATDHSLMVMPASLITGPHLSISRLRKAASSVGEEPATTTPSCCSLAFVAGSFPAVTVSACILAMISDGVRAGANNAYQEETSKPGTPTSAIGGMSGAAGVRCAVVTARPR